MDGDEDVFGFELRVFFFKFELKFGFGKVVRVLKEDGVCLVWLVLMVMGGLMMGVMVEFLILIWGSVMFVWYVGYYYYFILVFNFCCFCCL